MPGPLGIEADIIARIKDALTWPGTVASSAAIGALDIEVAGLALPLVMVSPGGAQVTDQSRNADHVIERQDWTIAILDRQRPDREALTMDFALLDSFILGIIGALTGWQPAQGLRPLRYQSRDPQSLSDGYVEVTLRFTTDFHLSAQE